MNILTPPPHDEGSGLDSYSTLSGFQRPSEALVHEAPALAAALGILSDFLQKGSCKPAELPAVLRNLHETCLAALREENPSEEGRAGHWQPTDQSQLQSFLQRERRKRRDANSPAVPVEESITDNSIICLEDGKRVKALSRYLRSHYGMTMEEYRLRWNLPDDYPAVPPALSRRRAEVARENKPHFNRANVSRRKTAAADFSGSSRKKTSSKRNKITHPAEEMRG